MSQPLLAVEGLTCVLDAVARLHEVSFALVPGERVGLFGPSGAGKSLVLRNLLGLAPRGATVSGVIRWQGEALTPGPSRALAALRGRGIAMVPQACVESLDPVRPIRKQITELVDRHRSPRGAREVLALAGFPTDAIELRPAQLSGGMAQRVALAAAMACGPRLLLADEPTASLDNILQAAVLDAIFRACDEDDTACLLVSHDLAVIARHCSRVIVMEEGRVVADETIASLLETSDARLRELVDACRLERDVS